MRKLLLVLICLLLTNILFAQLKSSILFGAIRSETPITQYYEEFNTDPGYGIRAGVEVRYEYRAISIGLSSCLSSTKYNGTTSIWRDRRFSVMQFAAYPFVAIKPVKAVNLHFGFSPVLNIDIQNELIQSPNIPSSGGKYWAGKLFANYEYKRFGIEIAYVKFYDHYYSFNTIKNSSDITKVYCYFSNIELTLKYNFFQYSTN